MTTEVVQFPSPGRCASPSLPMLQERLHRIVSIFHAIEAGQLLAAVPNCPVAFADHRAALTLLGMAEQEVMSLCSELDS